MNQKLKIRYNEMKEKLLDLEDDTNETINSQLQALAEKTNEGINKYPRLKSALLDETVFLDEATEMFERVAKKTKETSDIIKTSIKEAEHHQMKSDKGKKFINMTNAQIDYEEKKINHFAQGNTFYKLFWVFFIGCFAGVIIETIFCIVTRGHYESRVGLIYGPFNLVYGFGALALSLVLYPYRNRSKIYSFAGGFIVGSIIEYLCSFFQEMAFGSVSWDYSKMPFNLNGRICLLYSIFWGILGVLWIKEVYPRMARQILKIPNKIGKSLTMVLLAFMIFNSCMSGIMVYRWSNRINNLPPATSIGEYADVHYPNERMEKLFPNLKFVEK